MSNPPTGEEVLDRLAEFAQSSRELKADVLRSALAKVWHDGLTNGIAGQLDNPYDGSAW